MTSTVAAPAAAPASDRAACSAPGRTRLPALRENGRLRFWVAGWGNGDVAPARCGLDDGFVHPSCPDSTPGMKATGPATDPCSLDETAKGCSRLRSGT
ncbi:hypothetical protein [Streptosporangium sp. NPDC023615]|uniref:hypothetical protein n=1 Tax=Streptosporangium sp. NPDC023615 TaxID=3154794 RepID=UPI0034188D95